MLLSDLQTGDTACIININGKGAFKKRILEMGFVRGQEVTSILNAPLNDPVKYGVMGYEVSLRRSEAALIEISTTDVDIADTIQGEYLVEETDLADESSFRYIANGNLKNSKTINVALVGNPNSGKTSIFNLASGLREHVGNYSGVTVDSKEGILKYKDYTFRLIDLPGTYSLAAYSIEELFVRKCIFDKNPDIIINVTSASAIERSLYLTTELIELKRPMVIALNMYDELQKSGSKLDYQTLSKRLGVPIVPTVGKNGTGIPKLLDTIIETFETKGLSGQQQITIPYGRVLERAKGIVNRELNDAGLIFKDMPTSYVGVKLLEGDSDIKKAVAKHHEKEKIYERVDKEQKYIERLIKQDAESAFTNARYAFISETLKDIFVKKQSIFNSTKRLDAILTNKYMGLPFFLIFLSLTFEATFRLGSYPMSWIESLIGLIGSLVQDNMADGPLRDMIADGIIGGVGAVIVFLPNIMILYLFISFMEDSGYMARAAFIVDKLMRKIGLQGKSFIPMVMGFGCNVPAIISTRTVESRTSRMITVLIIPFMSCNARLPVYILFLGTFFPQRGGLYMIGLYVTGVLLAAISALIFRKFFFKGEDTPFVMELPPYRMPTVRSVAIHMWDRARQYLLKMGGPILVASIIIWFLSYFPMDRDGYKPTQAEIAQIEQTVAESEGEKDIDTEIEHLQTLKHQESSYIGRLGKTIEPVMRPLGFDWKMSVSLLSGMAAKEVVISTMGVLYTGDSEDEESLPARLKSDAYEDGSPVFTDLVVVGFLLFILIYFPCIATIAAIKEEAHSWKWAVFSVFYTTGLAWLVAFAIFRFGHLLGF